MTTRTKSTFFPQKAIIEMSVKSVCNVNRPQNIWSTVRIAMHFYHIYLNGRLIVCVHIK